jgi:hypothetical protein
MELQTAISLRDSLTHMEEANQALRAAPDDEVVAAAEAYQRSRGLAGPAFAAAQREYELAQASEPGATEASVDAVAGTAAEGPIRREAAPGVPLIGSPTSVVNAANLADFGALFWYIPTGGEASADAAPPVQATPYAFDAGTAVETSAGEVATAQPSRIVVGADGLGVVPQDVFGQAYANCPPDLIPDPTAQPAQTPAETPVGGAQDAPAPAAAETPAEAPVDPQTPAEGSTPPSA